MNNLNDQRGRPLHDLRLSLIDRCNLRCQYCMPKDVFGSNFAFMPAQDWLNFDEIKRLVATCLDLGLRKLRLTGGEPLLRPRITELIQELRSLSSTLDIALTTNGTRLAALAKPMAQAGLKRINLSLDAIAPNVSELMAGQKIDLNRIIQGIKAAQDAGLECKLNAVIKRGVNESEIIPLAQFAREHQVTLRFIEYMDVGKSNRWQRDEVITGAEILQILQSVFSFHSSQERSGSAIARLYQDSNTNLQVGFINSVSQPFCQGCNRMRISADGQVYTCLFSDKGHNLKPYLSADRKAELKAQLQHLWMQRSDRYSEIREQKDTTNKVKQRAEMWALGG